MASITPVELNSLLKQDPNLPLIDVRTPSEFKRVHVPSAINLPLDALSTESLGRLIPFETSRSIYILCRSSARAEIAAAKLAAAGQPNGIVISGGTLAWQAAGYPVNKGPGSDVSLERQVRLAAGLIVLSGIVLGWLVAPEFLLLAAFAGFGLVLAGLTDWCGMGQLLAKAPWNQARL